LSLRFGLEEEEEEEEESKRKRGEGEREVTELSGRRGRRPLTFFSIISP
jgi:hypothetical protein